MDRIKIGDGDLLIVVVGGDTTQADIATIRKRFEDWTSKRGLQDITINVFGGLDNKGLDIKVLSVNDVFEDEVLNKK